MVMTATAFNGVVVTTYCSVQLDDIAGIRWCCYCFCCHRQSMSGAFYFDTLGRPFRPHTYSHCCPIHIYMRDVGSDCWCWVIARICDKCRWSLAGKVPGGERTWGQTPRLTTNDRIRYIRLSKFVLHLDGFAVSLTLRNASILGSFIWTTWVVDWKWMYFSAERGRLKSFVITASNTRFDFY